MVSRVLLNGLSWPCLGYDHSDTYYFLCLHSSVLCIARAGCVGHQWYTLVFIVLVVSFPSFGGFFFRPILAYVFHFVVLSSFQIFNSPDLDLALLFGFIHNLMDLDSSMFHNWGGCVNLLLFGRYGVLIFSLGIYLALDQRKRHKFIR